MRLAVCLLLSIALTGCAARVASRDVPVEDSARGAAVMRGAESGTASLERFMAEMRALSAEARPERSRAVTVEAADPELRSALADLAALPSPATTRRVAHEYARLGIFDRAYYYFHRALRLDPGDAAAHDGLARLWRNSGLPHLGLTDAYRAVFYAPDSPVAHNTLGTILQALGHRRLALAQYERALQFEPRASYALNNLCYAWVLEGASAKAIPACTRALELQPDLKAAQNNLALAHAAAGNLDAAKAAFAGAGDRAEALFNTGIVHLAHREYGKAVDAFAAAHAARPNLRAALIRADQAAAHAQAASEE